MAIADLEPDPFSHRSKNEKNMGVAFTKRDLATKCLGNTMLQAKKEKEEWQWKRFRRGGLVSEASTNTANDCGIGAYVHAQIIRNQAGNFLSQTMSQCRPYFCSPLAPSELSSSPYAILDSSRYMRFNMRIATRLDT